VIFYCHSFNDNDGDVYKNCGNLTIVLQKLFADRVFRLVYNSTHNTAAT